MEVSFEDRERREALFDRYWSLYGRLVLSILRSSSPVVDEDVLQVGKMAMWEAIRTYRSDRGMRFSSWLWRVTKYRILEWRSLSGYPVYVPSHLLKHNRIPDIHAVPVDTVIGRCPVSSDEDSTVVPESLIYDETGYNLVCERVDMERLLELLKRELSGNQWYCLVWHLGLIGEPQSLESIAGRLGVSRQRVHQLVTTALDRVRNSEAVRGFLGV